jgi:UDP-xylose/UDP-N-acetylglucosamine transporter B4
MGLYTEEIYRIYGPQWRENLFYCHVLSLPLFMPFMPSLIRQFMKLARSPPLHLEFDFRWIFPFQVDRPLIPSKLVFLLANVLTQFACIRGVNLLAAASSALTVTIVLNIRKLASLLLSIWLFENQLSLGTIVGAVIVFGAGALYSLDSRRKFTAGSKKKS